VLVGAKTKKQKSSLGTLDLRVSCNENATATLAGTLTELIGKKPKHGKQRHETFRFATAHKSLTANHAVVITVTLPKRALTALANHASESATFTLTAHDASGASRTTTKIKTLKPTR
jgi:hypothetical protein